MVVTMRRRSKSFSVISRGGAGLLIVGLLLIAAFTRSIASSSLTVTNLSQQESQNAERLFPDKPLERKLAGGETHLYEVSLSANQFLRLLVEQRGVDVGLIIFSPEGARVREVDIRHGERGAERVSLIAKRAGNYRIEVRSIRRKALPGNYQIIVEEPLRRRRAQPLTPPNNSRRRRCAPSTVHQESLAQESRTGRRCFSRGRHDLRVKADVLNLIGSHFSLGEYRKHSIITNRRCGCPRRI
jgi:hypothetical protein